MARGREVAQVRPVLEVTPTALPASGETLELTAHLTGNAGFSPSFPGVKTAPLALDNGGVTLHILVDASSVEVYAVQGQVTLTDQIFADGGTATLDNIQGWHLQSSWN
jgi:sucrose-6-phosphate hydrolase SacC (GH32 family)